MKGLQDWYRYFEGSSKDPSPRNLSSLFVRPSIGHPSAKVADSEKSHGRRMVRDLLIISVIGIIGFVWASGFKSFELFQAWAREHTALFGLILVFAFFVFAGWIVSLPTVLRALAGCMQTLTRGYDIACRYGGEEFTLILPDADLDVTVLRAEQLRETYKHLDVLHQGRSLRIGTLSLGVADFPQHGSTAEIILRAADAALFHAKAGGRDRVVVAEAIGADF